MFGKIIKTAKGKWAIALVMMAVLALIGGLSEGQNDFGTVLGGAALLIVIAGCLVLSEVKAIKNPPAPPTLAEQGIYVPQEALDAFLTREILPTVQNTPVMLSPGETAVYYCEAVRVETKNRMIGKTGAGGSTSIRVAKGVRLRTGGGGSQNVYGDIEMTAQGQFVATTERIIFVAGNKAFTENLSNISAISTVNDCLAIVTPKQSYSLRMASPEYPCAIIKRCITDQ